MWTREKDSRMLLWLVILSPSRNMRVKSCRWTWFLDHAADFSVDSWSAIYSMNPLLNAPLPWSVSQDLAVESKWREKLYGAQKKYDNKSPFSSKFFKVDFLASMNSSRQTTSFRFFLNQRKKLQLKVSGTYFGWSRRLSMGLLREPTIMRTFSSRMQHDRNRT